MIFLRYIAGRTKAKHESIKQEKKLYMESNKKICIEKDRFLPRNHLAVEF